MRITERICQFSAYIYLQLLPEHLLSSLVPAYINTAQGRCIHMETTHPVHLCLSYSVYKYIVAALLYSQYSTQQIITTV